MVKYHVLLLLHGAVSVNLTGNVDCLFIYRYKSSVAMLTLIQWLWRVLLLTVVFSGQKANVVQTVLYQSHLCAPMDLPCVKGSRINECRMKYYKLNSTDCRDLTFSRDFDNEINNEFGSVELNTYHFNLSSYKQTGFNVTLKNIGWNNLKFRFKQEGNEMKNACREFHMSANATILNLFYDCLWSNETYEGKTFIFEYEMGKNNVVSSKKYYFQVPFSKNIDEDIAIENWEIFVYTEVSTNVLGATTLILHWTPLPERFSINTYNVTVYANESGQMELIFSTNITCTKNEECKFYYYKWYGNVQFGVQPVSRIQSECLTSKTIIFKLGRENTQSLLIGIVSVTLIVPAFIYFIFLMRNYFYSNAKNWFYSVPKLLVVFTPSTSLHVNVVVALVEYMHKYCHVEPLVDELHIHHSESRDPFKWCNEAVKSAECVMIIASPSRRNLQPSNSVYQRTDVLLLRLLQEKISYKNRQTNIFVLMLPYCTESDIPEEAINLKRFSFPGELNKMLEYIHKNNSLPCCLGADVYGGKTTYESFGTKLNNAIVETQMALSKSPAESGKTVFDALSPTSRASSDQLLLDSPQEEVKVKLIRDRGKDSRNVTVAGEAFSEFPGHLDDMNLSGDEAECLMTHESSRKSLKGEVINLDALDL